MVLERKMNLVLTFKWSKLKMFRTSSVPHELLIYLFQKFIVRILFFLLAFKVRILTTFIKILKNT